MNHHIEKHPLDRWYGALPYHYPCHPCPDLPRLPDVTYHRRTIIICRFQDPPQLFERGDRRKRPSVGLKVTLCALLHILFCQPLSLPIRLIGALSGGCVPPAQGLPEHQHVALS